MNRSRKRKGKYVIFRLDSEQSAEVKRRAQNTGVSVSEYARRALDSSGKLGMHVDLSVSLSEMRRWEPVRIAAYFRGIATVCKAVRGESESGGTPARCHTHMEDAK